MRDRPQGSFESTQSEGYRERFSTSVYYSTCGTREVLAHVNLYGTFQPATAITPSVVFVIEKGRHLLPRVGSLHSERCKQRIYDLPRRQGLSCDPNSLVSCSTA
jgi:hypothetical protein